MKLKYQTIPKFNYSNFITFNVMQTLMHQIFNTLNHLQMPEYELEKILGNENDSSGRMILVFTTTFIIITSTSVAHGPFAAHAASTKQQQNKHK